MPSGRYRPPALGTHARLTGQGAHRCQSIDSHARASPSGPFTPPQPGVQTVLRFPRRRHRALSPAHLTHAGVLSGRGTRPVSGQFPGGSRWEERPGASRSCRLSAHRHSIVGSSCARWGSAPPSRSVYRVRPGPHRGCHVARARDPTGAGALYTPGVRCPRGGHRQSGRRWPPHSGPPLYPGAASTSPGLG
jgi:hypothetical protein